MKPEPPRVAVWCLSRLAYGKRAPAIVGDLLERFADGESRFWFWRQTLSTLARGFAQAAREHGTTFIAALVTAVVVLFAAQFTNAFIVRHVLHFQTHALLQFDPDWTQRWFWRGVFILLGTVQSTFGFAIAGWLVTRIHRAQPRLIVVACAFAVLALQLPRTIQQAQNLLTHSRFLDYFLWNLFYLCLSLSVLLAFGWWGSRQLQKRKARA